MADGTAAARILTVGVGEEYATIRAAIAASQDGDVIKVDAGTYVNDFATITHKISLEAVGGVVNMQATQPPPNKKGILVVNNDVTIDGFSFSGAKISAADGNNGAGIRYQAGNLTLNHTYFFNNQDGILATPGVAGTGSIDIENSEFANNGAGDGYSHNIYVGNIASFTFNNSYSHDAKVGHDIKSRALVTTITNSRIQDGVGTASYSIDLPNGGIALLRNNVIEQGANSQNPSIIAFGEEGGLKPNSSLTLDSNVIVNDLTKHAPVGVWNPKAAPVSLSGTYAYGLTAAQLVSGPATQTGTTLLDTRPALDTTSHWQPPILPGNTVPGSVTIGSGSDTLALQISEDAWKGDAQFTLSIDGTRVGGTQTAVANHDSAQTQTYLIHGTFGTAPHTVSVRFLNDAYGGTHATDRNLYVDSATINGAAVAGGSLSLVHGGTQSFTFQQSVIVADRVISAQLVAPQAGQNSAMAFITGAEVAPLAATSEVPTTRATGLFGAAVAPEPALADLTKGSASAIGSGPDGVPPGADWVGAQHAGGAAYLPATDLQAVVSVPYQH